MNMNVSKAKWIFFCFICYVECQYLFFSSLETDWFSAQSRCKHFYNGFLADKASIVERVDVNRLKECIKKDAYWLGQASVWSEYIIIDGCYELPHLFHSNSPYQYNMSIFKCQMQCYYSYGFAIKGRYCICLLSQYDIDQYTKTDFGNCTFACRSNHCGFYGGEHAVSIYRKSNPQRNDHHPCLFFECKKGHSNKYSVNLQGSTCGENISAYCANNLDESDQQTWLSASEYCISKRSYLISNFSGDNCRKNLKIWSNERRYKEYYRSKDMTVKNDTHIRCAFTNFTDGNIRFSTECLNHRTFVCITDIDTNLPSASCYINISKPTSEETSFDTSTNTHYQTITASSSVNGKKRQTTDNTATIIAVVIGILCCIAVVVIVYLVYRKRRFKNDGLPQNESKNKSYETIQGDRGNESFSYDLAKPQVSEYDDIDLETRQSTIDNYAYPDDVSQCKVRSPDLENASEKHRITESENDYDHLRQQWDRPKDKDTECEYSPSAADDDDHPYNITKRGITRVDHVEDDYSHMTSLKDSNIYDK